MAGLYSKHVPIVPVLVELWSGQVNSGPWEPDWASSRKKTQNVTQPYGAQLINEETDFINRLTHA